MRKLIVMLTPLAGNDFIDGGTGADAMTGGLGDELYGEEGNDRVRWRIRAATINGSQAANDETTHTWRIAA